MICYTNGAIHELGGAERETTNNRMEMQAAIAALEWMVQAQQSEPITLYTDSEYLINGITKWIQGWKRKGWKTSSGKAVLNQDLWMILDELRQQLSHKVHWTHVRGHSGNEGNERCDAIARGFAAGSPPPLRQREDGDRPSVINHKNTTNENKTIEKPIISLDSDISSRVVDSTSVTETIESCYAPDQNTHPKTSMSEPSGATQNDSYENLPREVRVAQLQHVIETLHIADEIARQGYLITSAELADLMDVNASAVTSRGDNWVWRNWVVSRVRREGNQILWQLERVD
jgi:ribonuclease HI